MLSASLEDFNSNIDEFKASIAKLVPEGWNEIRIFATPGSVRVTIQLTTPNLTMADTIQHSVQNITTTSLQNATGIPVVSIDTSAPVAAMVKQAPSPPPPVPPPPTPPPPSSPPAQPPPWWTLPCPTGFRQTPPNGECEMCPAGTLQEDAAGNEQTCAACGNSALQPFLAQTQCYRCPTIGVNCVRAPSVRTASGMACGRAWEGRGKECTESGSRVCDFASVCATVPSRRDRGPAWVLLRGPA
jgi:hypothetical protein